ncbi:MAG TPA: bifunctional DNA-formamidopyrimidine glycosylase/DNA-(apurinic or apyrimidinic site) lyase [Vicinamibacterales bacterium]|nr:bifunctional DNA-formamidopyrimidine glycosylase/DNA-(apurinic or apyrimidinic site) lyase [Vicinamibacterales bacterium]
MPELPEVEEVRRRLRPVMAGAKFDRVLVHRSDLRFPIQPDFASRLEGRTVKSLGRRAKYLVAELSSGDVLLMHLGMSGSFRVESDGGRDRPADYYWEPERSTLHDHVVFELSSGVTVVFNDPRRFGSMRIVAAPDLGGDPALAALGPEPLSRGFDAAVLARALKGRRIPLKAALSDQRVVAGLGNIYASEALHVARLSPTRRASTLVTPSGAPRPEAQRLVAAIKDVLRQAMDKRHRAYTADRFRVYDREGERCPRRGCGGVIKRIVQSGRSTFFCQVCQRAR